MFLYFISALLISIVLFKLGSYWTIINIMTISGKALVALLLVAELIVVVRKLLMSRRKVKQKTLPYRSS